MKSVYKWSTIVTLLLSVILFVVLVWFVETKDTVLFAVLSGVLASMIVMAVSNSVTWFLVIEEEKIFLRNEYTKFLDVLGDSLNIIKYAQSYKSGLPGVNELLSKYQELSTMIQRLFMLHDRDNMPDYYRLQSIIEKVSIKVKKINNLHKVVKTDSEILAAYQDIVDFLLMDKNLKSFIDEIGNLKIGISVKKNK